MKFFITGSSGFIGSRVVAGLLAKGHEVTGLDRRAPTADLPPGATYVEGDLLDRERMIASVVASRAEVVIHLAAKTGLREAPPDSPHFAANTRGTENLMDGIRQAGTVRRALYTSTKYVYRGAPPAPHREYEPNTSYGRSKAAMEELVWEADGAAAEWCIVRPTTIWGPGMSPHYRKFLRLVRAGRYVHFGAGDSLKHLGFIENTAAQIVGLALAPAEAIQRRVLYVGDYDAIRVGDWAEAFRVAFGAPPIRSIPLPLARLAALAGDGLVKCGWRKFPLTSFRFRNLTEDDLCEMEPTRAICGESPYSLAESAARTARWFNEITEAGKP